MSDQAPRAGAEAARLVAAAQEWLRSSAPHLAPVDDEGRTCSCPLCRGIVRLRESDPDAVARWVDGAVAAFEHVVSEAAAGVASATGGTAGPDGADVAGETGDGPAAEPSDEARHDGPPPRTVRRVPLDEPGTARPARQRTSRED